MCAAATAIVVAVCTLLAGWHQATVLHARCAQHGELYHVGAGGHRIADHRIAARDGAETDEHDHCSMCPRTHDGAATRSIVVQVAMPPASAVITPAPRAIAIAARGTLHLAPKTSPPAPRSSLS